MPKRIILLSDGTGNSAAKVWRTNVWRVFESLDLSGSDQVAFYDDGVGTSSFKPLAVIGGAFGYGLKRNVIELYKFACRNIRSNEDELFAFGFSRGAFTIRVVMGLIHSEGLVHAGSESELDRLARAAYRNYRRKRFHTYFRIEDIFRSLRDAVLRSDYDATRNLRFTNIAFLGLWDTVAAYGLPIEEMTVGVSNWLWPLELPDHDLNGDVKRACHALSIDDERTTFHPLLWNERKEKPAAPGPDGMVRTWSQRLTQVWFAGAHSNVGGGYPDDALAHIPLVWIMRESARCGLVFKSAPQADPDALKFAMSGRDKDGRLYNPRLGLGGFYRYGPRNLAELCSSVFSRKGPDEVFIETPKIHESVFERTRNAARAYAPLGLPARYDVVTDTDEVLSLAVSPYESKDSAAGRANRQEVAWNYVWARRLLYFLMIGVAAYLFAYPLAHALPKSDEFSTPFRWASDIIRIIGSALPGFADPWINGYARSPGKFMALVLVLVATIMASSRYASKIGDLMPVLWRNSFDGATGGALPGDALYRLRTRGWYISLRWALKRHISPLLSALGLLWLGATLISHVSFNVLDDAGFVCRPTRQQRVEPARGAPVTVEFDLRDVCSDTGVTVEEGKLYRISVAAKDEWKDASLTATTKGFYTSQTPWTKWPIYVLGLPLRRELIRPWFRVVARFGSTGGEEVFFDPDPDPATTKIEARVRATRDGELFFFVNDAVIGLPGLYDLFYRNNSGTGVVTITRIDP